MIVISVVIPSWNDAALLKNCLAALHAQSRPADEIIVVDNASTDETAKVARSAGAHVVTEPRHGVWPATIAGFDASHGDIIARLDADSVPPCDWLERVEVVLEGTGRLSAVTGPGTFYDGGRIMCWVGEHVYLAGYFWFVGMLLGHPPLFGSNFAISAEIWRRLRPRLDPNLERIHDDLMISHHLDPDMTVVYDRTLRVGVSARPFHTARGLGRRLGWAGLNLWQHRRLRRRLTRRGSVIRRRASRDPG